MFASSGYAPGPSEAESVVLTRSRADGPCLPYLRAAARGLNQSA